MIQNGSQNSSLNLMESAQLGKTNQIIPYTGRKTIKTTIAVKKCEMKCIEVLKDSGICDRIFLTDFNQITVYQRSRRNAV